MNCKPGDLAIVIKSEAGNEGRIVRCIRLASDRDLRPYLLKNDESVYGPLWLIDTEVNCYYGGKSPLMFDRYLRPIRPGDISDEEVRDLYAPKLPETA